MKIKNIFKLNQGKTLLKKIVIIELIFSTALAYPLEARPLIENWDENIFSIATVELDDAGSSGGTTGPDGHFRCDWGCGNNRSPDGNGWGNGTSKDYNKNEGEGASSSQEGQSGGSNGHGRSDEEYYSRFDTNNSSLSENEAWNRYNEFVDQVNKQWVKELGEKYKNSEVQSQNALSHVTDLLKGLNANDFLSTTTVPTDLSALISKNIPSQQDGYRYLIRDRSDILPLLEYEYVSDHKSELQSIRSAHSNIKPQSPQSYYSYHAGLSSLKRSDIYYSKGLSRLGSFFKEAGKILLDVSTDLNPLTGSIKDLYRTIVGKDPLSGQMLSPLERSFSAVFAIGGIFTLGGTNVVKLTALEIAKVAQSSLKEVRVAQEISNVIKASPIKVEVLVKGTSGEFTLIGREMARVTEVATALEKEGIKVNILNNFSDAANEEWRRLLEKYVKHPGDLIPYNIVAETKKMIENEKWIDAALSEGHTIIDLGNPMAKEASAFYEMEKRKILQYLRRM